MQGKAFIAGFLMLTGTMCHAQRVVTGHQPINAATMSPVRAMPAPAGATRYGNILFPGGVPQSFPSNLGRTVAGVPYTGVPDGYGGRGGRNRTMVIPYVGPVFGGGVIGPGFMPTGYIDPYLAQQPNVTVVTPQQPAPTVIINNYYSGQGPESTTVATADGDRNGLRVYEATPSRRSERAAEPAPSCVRAYVRRTFTRLC
jgi:hypothetical protein